MTIKKMLMLLGMALAAVAFAAPAMAQADVWVTDGGEVGESTETADEVTFSGSLTATAGPLHFGPCNVESNVDAWNEEGEATGEATNLTIKTPCPVSLTVGGTPIVVCEIVQAGPQTAFPWHVDVATNEIGAGTDVAITGASFFNITKGCPEGVPGAVAAKGTATGDWDNTAGAGCITFNNDGDLEAPTGAAVLLDGKLCAANLTLE